MEIYNFQISYCKVQDEIWYSLSKFVICKFIVLCWLYIIIVNSVQNYYYTSFVYDIDHLELYRNLIWNLQVICFRLGVDY